MPFQQPFLTLACVALLIVNATKPRKNPAFFMTMVLSRIFFALPLPMEAALVGNALRGVEQV